METNSKAFSRLQVCQQNFPDTYILKDHLKSYLTSGSFLCEQCTFIATSRKELTAHTTHVHNKQPTVSVTVLVRSLI